MDEERIEKSRLRRLITDSGSEWDLLWDLKRLREEASLFPIFPKPSLYVMMSVYVDKVIVYDKNLFSGSFKLRITVNLSGKARSIESRTSFSAGRHIEGDPFRLAIPSNSKVEIEFEILHKFFAASIYSVIARGWIESEMLARASALDLAGESESVVRIDFDKVQTSRVGINLFRSVGFTVLATVRFVRLLSAKRKQTAVQLDKQIRFIATRNVENKELLQMELLMETVRTMNKFMNERIVGESSDSGILKDMKLEIRDLKEVLTNFQKSILTSQPVYVAPPQPVYVAPPQPVYVAPPVAAAPPVIPASPGGQPVGDEPLEPQEDTPPVQQPKVLAKVVPSVEPSMMDAVSNWWTNAVTVAVASTPERKVASSGTSTPGKQLRAGPLIAAMQREEQAEDEAESEERAVEAEDVEADEVIVAKSAVSAESAKSAKAKALVKKPTAKAMIKPKYPSKAVVGAKAKTNAVAPTKPAPPQIDQQALVKARMLAVAKLKALEAKRAAEIQSREAAIVALAAKRPPIDKMKFPGMPGPPPFKPKNVVLEKPQLLPSVMAIDENVDLPEEISN